MRLILLDRPTPARFHFDPLALSRPIWELRCGMTSLAEKLIAKFKPRDVAGFLPPYLVDVYREQSSWPLNDAAQLAGDDLLLVNARVKAEGFDLASTGSSEAAFDGDGDCLFARIAAKDLPRLNSDSLEALLASVRESLPKSEVQVATWNYTWELVLENPTQITKDFDAAGRQGIEGMVEQPFALRGSKKNVYIAPGVLVHPMVVIDAEHGPVYIDEGDGFTG